METMRPGIKSLGLAALPSRGFMNYSRAALAVAVVIMTLAACSGSEEMVVEGPQQATAQTDGAKTYTMTISASKGGEAMTRALSLEGKTLNATWTKGDVVKVYTINASVTPSTFEEVGELTALNSGESTVLSGTITLNEKKLLYFYYGSPFYDFRNQKGTLDDVAANYDRAYAKLSTKDYELSDGKVMTSQSLDFKNQQAIVKFIIKDQSDNPITVSRLSVGLVNTFMNFDAVYDASTGTQTNLSKLDVVLATPASEVTLAIPAISLTVGSLTLETATDENDYKSEKTVDYAHPLNPTLTL